MDLILYVSKKGATKKVAEMILKNKPSAEILNIEEVKPDLDKYDNVYLGTSVYVGQINKEMKEYIQKNEQKLLSKNTKVFISSMNEPEFEKMVDLNFSDNFKSTVEIINVGGAYYFDKLKFLEKLIVRVIAKTKTTTESFKLEAINSI